VQLIRRNTEGRNIAWYSVHVGTLKCKDVQVELANLLPLEEFTPTLEDVVILRCRTLEGASTVSVKHLKLGPIESSTVPARTPGAMGPEGLPWPRQKQYDSSGDTVLIFGTFDVQNYGDLLFPIIAEHRLAREGMSITPVSPTDFRTPFDDAPRPLSIEAVAQRNPPGKGVLIGGGNIIHLRPTSLSDYQLSDLDRFAYPALWLGATVLAATYDLPIAWNAPGAPIAECSWPATEIFRSATAAADYLSIRDEESRNSIGATEHSVAIVPDTAVEISSIWPLSTLEGLARESLESRGFAPDARYIAVHVKERSLAGSPEVLAAELDALSAATNRIIALVAIGSCHGDDRLARRLGRMMRGPAAVLDRPSSLRQIAAIIACADIHLCSSLHAYITSFSYGRPGLLVGEPGYTKFEAFTRMVGRSEDQVPDWSTAFAVARDRLSREPLRLDLVSADIMRQLDDHWAAVAAALSDPSPGRGRRSDFLRTMTAISLKRAGWGPVLSGLVSPE
jgi:hypothetical protein